ncbi:MAG: DNA repair protein RecO [Dehalococcoidia bacterium]|nr:DNA repair protein RecO [Dehalococcoidia bacterium]
MPSRVPRVTRTEAIVLRHRRLGEADRIVTLLTPLRGKVDAVAKGALRPRSKLAGHLEPLTRVDVLLAHGRTLDVVTQAQMLDGLPALHADLDRLSMAMYLLELTDRLTLDRPGDDGRSQQPLYELLQASLVRIARGDGLHLAARSFEIALLELSGFRPEWRVCVGCGTEVSADRANWSPLAGGVICPDCQRLHPEAVAIEANALKVLRAIQDGPYEEAARIRLGPELAGAIERVMHTLMRATTERALGSAQFVADARRVAAASIAAATRPGDAAYTAGTG